MVTPADILIPPSHLAAPAPRPRLASRTSFSSAYYHPVTRQAHLILLSRRPPGR
ncbi:hypothetical protein PGTUg99_017128 [Puccinia graminis f. sp. tritici]|uniref:Uncharacterized protein n=1 Tax=Puccinia graminis f. sp. tritici TaxID=56615 RepID=A0A5B0SC54_PUCGR|nr:hypothetical protein PGTUg99_017128 [Puccinia graminis f. sp. tritici]